MRVQRTRSSPSAHRSPLTRYPLGAVEPHRWRGTLRAAVAAWLSVVVPLTAASSTIDSYGIFQDLPDGQGTELVRQTDTIEAQMHINFGFHFTTTGLRSGEQITLRKVVTHPAIQKPDGSVETSYEREIKTTVRSDGSVAGFQGFGFDHPYELVPGKWTIEVWCEGQQLAAKTFTITKPKRAK